MSKRGRAAGRAARGRPQLKHLTLAITAAIFGVASTAGAAIILVDDFGDAGGGCNLRNAILSANRDEAVAGCVAGSGDDLILFDETLVPGTISITGGTLEVTSDLYLGGPGADQLTITGDGSAQLFNISDGDPATDREVHIEGVTLSGGSGVLGGAINNFESLALVNSVVSGNRATYGGAIDNRGILTIVGSTLSANTATGRSGAISDYGRSLSITNSTISGNSAPLGGAIISISSASMRNVTIAQNSASSIGGLWGIAGATLVNTLIAENQDQDCVDADASVAPNLIGTGNCNAPILGPAVLGALQDNGGSTPTIALLEGSAAIDAGDNGDCPSEDQRQIRRSDGACDIGAFEFKAPPIEVNTTMDVVADDGSCSLREAISSAELDAPSGVLAGECGAGKGEDTIQFDLDPAFTVGLSLGELLIRSSVTIEGSSSSRRKVFGYGAGRIFHVDDADGQVNSLVTLRHLELSYGMAAAGGGAILNSEDLTVEESHISFNSTDGDGGAILNRGELRLKGSQVRFNEAGGNGGGLSSEAGSTAQIRDSSIAQNSAAGSGGGLHGTSDLSVFGSTISSNTATSGGGIQNDGGLLFVRTATVAHNAATGVGGGIHNAAGSLTLYGNIIANHGSAGDCVNADYLPYSAFNIVSDGSCRGRSVGDPGLAPLAPGASGLLGHRLLPDSPAIDTGPVLGCGNVDQDGAPRDVDGDGDGQEQCDVGALEAPVPIVVTTTDDTITDDGACSLREALAAVNDDQPGPDASDPCRAGTPGFPDTIIFDLPPMATIALANGELSVESPVAIGGPGAAELTISGGGQSRVFNISLAADVVSLGRISLTDGVAGTGGAVRHENPLLFLDRLRITGNEATTGGGVATEETIDALAILAIQSSTIDNNTASNVGGGISTDGRLEVRDSTISGNEADAGGGIHGDAYSFTTIDNSTLMDNSAIAGSGILVESYFGQSFSRYGGLALRNAVIAGGIGGPDCERFNPPFVVASLIQDGSCNPTLAGDPGLDALDDSRGETPIHAPLEGSILIDTGDDAVCTARDQRGLARPRDGDGIDGVACDIGAIEFVGPDALFDDGFEGDDPPEL